MLGACPLGTAPKGATYSFAGCREYAANPATPNINITTLPTALILAISLQLTFKRRRALSALSMHVVGQTPNPFAVSAIVLPLKLLSRIREEAVRYCHFRVFGNSRKLGVSFVR